jgi:hypothetical protein
VERLPAGSPRLTWPRARDRPGARSGGDAGSDGRSGARAPEAPLRAQTVRCTRRKQNAAWRRRSCSRDRAGLPVRPGVGRRPAPHRVPERATRSQAASPGSGAAHPGRQAPGAPQGRSGRIEASGDLLKSGPAGATSWSTGKLRDPHSPCVLSDCPAETPGFFCPDCPRLALGDASPPPPERLRRNFRRSPGITRPPGRLLGGH